MWIYVCIIRTYVQDVSDNKLIIRYVSVILCKYFHYHSDVGTSDDCNDDVDLDPGII